MSVRFCVHNNSKNNKSINLKLEYVLVYENSSHKSDIGHCLIKSRDVYISGLDNGKLKFSM